MISAYPSRMGVLRRVPPEVTAQRATEVLCQIFADRHPGTRWRALPLERPPVELDAGTRKVDLVGAIRTATRSSSPVRDPAPRRWVWRTKMHSISDR